jgi:hypothetical protein
MPKPSDFFVGVMDFFAILLPGALVTALLDVSENALDFAGDRPGSTERWAAFLAAAYVLGHVLHAAGALLLDRFTIASIGTVGNWTRVSHAA